MQKKRLLSITLYAELFLIFNNIRLVTTFFCYKNHFDQIINQGTLIMN